MKISVDTEIEEIEELRHAIAILEDALKRRENPDLYEDETSPSEESEPSDQNEKPQLNNEETQIGGEGDAVPSTESQETQQPEPQSNVDISSLTMSDYGEETENRTMDTPTEQPVPETPSMPEPPQQNNKELVKEIIIAIRNQNPGQPIQMQEILAQASNKNVSEDDTRNLVSELQKEGSI